MILFFAVFGLIFGSFIAAYTYRFPRGIKITEGRSFCDNCGKKISWYENIPVLSYIFLKGRCQKCHKKISTRYPIIELLTSAGFFTIYNLQGLSFECMYSILIFLILEIIFVIDYENQIIPDDFVFSGIFFVFLYQIITGTNVLSSFLAGLLSSLFLLLLFIFTKGRGMGLGDVKFAVFGGMVVGINFILSWMFFSFVTGAFFGMLLILTKNAKLKDKVAFGPFLVMGIPLALLWGSKIIQLMNL